MSLTEQLRTALKQSKQTRYAIAVGAGVDHAVLRRFLNGERSIKIETADRLAAYLKLELRPQKSKSTR